MVCGDSGANEEVVDRLFITIGHTGWRQVATRSGPKRMICEIYPLPTTVERIAAGTSVGVEGLGLAAMDTIAALTVGRSGRFRRASNNCMSYVASGNEPRIILYSRSGLPFHVRPETRIGRERHRALFLTPDMIAEFRRDRPDGRIDFEANVLPLIEYEMQAAFYLTCADIQTNPARTVNRFALRCEMVAAFTGGKLRELFARLGERYGVFLPNQHLLISVPQGIEGEAYVDWVRQFLEEDLKEGAKGLLASPLKAALEVWRDLRDAIRAVVDHGGLTEESHCRFFTTYVRLVNRTVAGPQKERHQELLALIEAGIVVIAPGINPRVMSEETETEKIELTFGKNTKHTCNLDWIVCARIADSRISETNSTFLAALSQAGLVRPVYPISGMNGVEIDVNQHPINIFGNAIDNIWIHGPLVEGSTYYNHYIPSDGEYSKALSDAHCAVCACLGSGNVNGNELMAVA